MPAPRPILKGLASSSETASNPLPFSSCPTILDSPHVHFPPTPTLTSTEITHSSFIYDRAPIVVTPNVCALPERGGRKFIGSSNQGGIGYFHPHAKFQVNAAVRVEQRDHSVETVSPTIFSASVTVGNVNNESCGSVELLSMTKRSGGSVYDYDYEYDQYSSHHGQYTQQQQHAEHVVSSLLFDHSSDSSDLGVFYTRPPPCIPPTPSSSSSTSTSSSIPHSTLSISPRNVYITSTASSMVITSTATSSSSSSSTAGSSNNHTASHSDKQKKTSMDVDRKKRSKNRVEGECRTKRTPSGSYASPDLDLEGCLGGF